MEKCQLDKKRIYLNAGCKPQQLNRKYNVWWHCWVMVNIACQKLKEACLQTWNRGKLERNRINPRGFKWKTIGKLFRGMSWRGWQSSFNYRQKTMQFFSLTPSMTSFYNQLNQLYHAHLSTTGHNWEYLSSTKQHSLCKGKYPGTQETSEAC